MIVSKRPSWATPDTARANLRLSARGSGMLNRSSQKRDHCPGAGLSQLAPPTRYPARLRLSQALGAERSWASVRRTAAAEPAITSAVGASQAAERDPLIAARHSHATHRSRGVDQILRQAGFAEDALPREAHQIPPGDWLEQPALQRDRKPVAGPRCGRHHARVVAAVGIGDRFTASLQLLLADLARAPQLE